MDIVFSAQNFLNEIGGAEFCAQTLVKNLSKKNRVKVISCGLKNEYQWFDINIHEVDCPNNILYINLFWKKYLAGCDADIVFTQGNAGAATVDWAKEKNIPSVFHIRSLDHISLDLTKRYSMDNLQTPNFFHPFELLKYPAYNFVYEKNALAMRDASLVVCQSKFMADLVEKYCNVKPVVLPMLMDLEGVKTELVGGSILIVNLQRHKGGDLISKIISKLPQYKFEICGLVEDEYDWIGKFPNVKVHGKVCDMRKFYRLGRILLAPYPLSENFPRTIFEAGVNGIPSICLEGGGSAEAVGLGGVSLPENIGKWIASIKYLMEEKDLWENISEGAKMNAARYSLDKSISALDDMIKSKLGFNLF